MSYDEQRPPTPRGHAIKSLRAAITRLDEALAEIEDVRTSPAVSAMDYVFGEALNESYRRATEALAWAQHALRRWAT